MATRVGPSYSWNVLCDRCGWKFKNNEVKVDWQGFVVCEKCYEPRHPLEFFHTRSDAHKLPYIRADNNGTDVSPPYHYPPGTYVCTIVTSQPLADIGVADCMTITS